MAWEYSVWFKQRAWCLFRLARRGILPHQEHQIVWCNLAVARETSWHLVMRDFTYGCTWRWCAGSWAAGACTRGFSSHGRQTWRMGLFSPCIPSPGTGRISPCCPVRKAEYTWLKNKAGEVAESQVQPALTCKMQCCTAQINQIPLPAATCRNRGWESLCWCHSCWNAWIHGATGHLYVCGNTLQTLV